MVVWFGKGGQRGGQVGERARVNVNACCQNMRKYGSYTNENTYTVKHVVLPYWCVFVLARCQVPLAIFGTSPAYFDHHAIWYFLVSCLSACLIRVSHNFDWDLSHRISYEEQRNSCDYSLQKNNLQLTDGPSGVQGAR
jgi:hypothetical protein